MPEKKQNPLNAFLTLIIVGAGLWYFFKGSSDNSAATPASAQSAALPAIAVNSQVLDHDYEANELAADNKYKNHMVYVTGRVTAVGKDILNSPYVGLAGDADGIFEVQCFVTHESEARAAELNKGDVVVIYGRVDGKMGNVAVKDCIFSTPDQHSSIQTVDAPTVTEAQSAVAGIYEYSMPSGAYDESGIPIQTKYTLELRSDKSFVSTKDTGLPSYAPNGLGSTRSKGSWIQTGAEVVTSVEGKAPVRWKVEGMDLIDPNGNRFLRTR